MCGLTIQTGRREHHDERQHRYGEDGRRPQEARRAVKRGRDPESHRGHEGREGREAVPSEDALDDPEQDSREPLVGHEGAAARKRRIVIDPRHVPGLQDHRPGLQVQEEVVIGDGRESEHHDEQTQRGKGRRFADEWLAPRSPAVRIDHSGRLARCR